jgi:hypothetical protein
VVIIVPNVLGNGLSSSPSNTPPPWDRARFPRISVRDNVESRYRLSPPPAGGRGLGGQPHARRATSVNPGVWGHFAGGGRNPVDVAFIEAGVRELLADT